MRKKDKFLLVLVVFIAFVLRISFLSHYPPSLNWDEVSHGYNAYSILKTGMDEWGSFFPITNFRAYGDYPLPLNLYLTIPFIASFGLNDFAVRLPHALLGVLTILASYFLFWGITKRKDISLTATLLVAIEPWHMFTSRVLLQSNLSVFFLTLAMALFFCREKHKTFLPLSLLSLGLTLFSYHTTRIFTPLVLPFMFFIYRYELFRVLKKEKLTRILILLILFVFFVPLPFILSRPESRARSNVVFILSESAINQIIKQREESNFPPTVKRLLYNRATYFTTHFMQNYIQYFSPQFLFFKGGTQYQFSVPNHGLLYLVNMPLFYFGLILLLKRVFGENKDYKLVFVWLALAPIPASLTTEDFAVLRSTTILPLPQLLSALGFFFLLEKANDLRILSKKIFYPLTISAYLVLLLAGMVFYMNIYLGGYRTDYSWSWQYGYKEVVDYVRANYSKYDKIIVTKKYGEPHEFILFFWPWDPGKFQEDKNLVRFYQDNWYWVDRFDKFFFVNDWDIPDAENGGWRVESGEEIPIDGPTLLVTSPGNYPDGWNMLKRIYFLNGEIAFEILTNSSLSESEL